MLALSRKKGEAILIDGDIEIRVIDIQGDKVKLGINAPHEKSIYREEVYEIIKGSNKQAQFTQLKKNEMNQIKNLMVKTKNKKL